MKQLLLFCLGWMMAVTCIHAQTSFGLPGPYWVGENTLNFSDSGLQVPNVVAKAWFPSPTSGNSNHVATGAFPVLVFGHGFNLNYLDYQQICSHLASWGFIVASPDVQNGFNVSHEEFAREMAACIQFLQAEDANTASMWHQHVDSMCGALGHSMGGGAAGLVPSVFPSIDAVSGLASAETNPSAIAALTSYSGPYQVIGGTQDNVANESSNQIPMYNACTGPKHRVSIIGGAHCKFTDGNTICDLVSGGGSISRQAQIDISKKYLTAFFAYSLNNDPSAEAFLCGDSILADQSAGKLQFETNRSCLVALADEYQDAQCLQAGPNPFQSKVLIFGEGAFTIYNAMGQAVFEGIAHGRTEILLNGLPNGIYYLHAQSESCIRRLLKQ